MEVSRVGSSPLIIPGKNWWEFRATFNPGATIYQDQILILYRAVGGDNLSRIGLAKSSDSLNFQRFDEPILEGDLDNSYERLGVEDPRITKIDETYYIVYTGASVYQADTYHKKNFAPSLSNPAPWRVRPSLLTTNNFESFQRKGILLNIDTKDACFLPEKLAGFFLLYHRTYPDVLLSYSKDLTNWSGNIKVFSPRSGYWDEERVGMGAPPIKTEKGWLCFYHGTNSNHHYQIGVILLDLADPAKVIYRSSKPILVPETSFEKEGETPNVVFTCGAIEKNNEFLIYYGAADKVIALAKVQRDKLFEYIDHDK